jgi:hypothetical protein
MIIANNSVKSEGPEQIILNFGFLSKPCNDAKRRESEEKNRDGRKK